MKNFILILIVIAIFSPSLSNADNGRLLKGIIVDAQNGNPIPGTKLSLIGTNKGTFASGSGKFRLNIPQGKAQLKATSIGYNSKTIDISEGMDSITIKLIPSPVNLESVQVTEKITPEQIITRAIEKKKENISKIKTFKGLLYSKLALDLNGSLVSDAKSSGNSVSISSTLTNSQKNQQVFLLETFSQAFNDYDKKIFHSVILQRRQTSNMNPDQNLLTIGNFISFYNDEIDFMNAKMPSPLSDKALSFYNYELLDRMALDNRFIYILKVKPISDLYPTFEGTIKIVEGTYNIVEIDLQPSKSTSIAFLDSIQIRQKYSENEDFIWYPSYLELKGKAKVELIKGFKDFYANLTATSIYNEAEINKPLPDSIYSLQKASKVTVDSKADTINPDFWENNSLREISENERMMYAKSDSLKKKDSVKAEESFFSYGYFPYFDFNRVSSIDLGMDLSFNLGRTRLSLTPNYSFGLEKWFIEGEYKIDFIRTNYMNISLSLGGYSSIQEIGLEPYHSRLLNSIAAAFSHFDYYDYMQVDGFQASLNARYSSLQLGLSVSSDRNFSLMKSTDKSLFEDKLWRSNPKIDDGNYMIYNISLKYGGLNTFSGDDSFNYEITLNSSLINEQDKNIESKNIYGSLKVAIPTFYTGYKPMMLNLGLFGGIADENSPRQYQYVMPSKLWLISQFGNFLTVYPNEFGGTNYYSAHASFNLTDMWWRYLGLPLYEGRGLDLILNASAGKYNNTNSSIYSSTKNDFYSEVGFGINRIPTFISNVIYLSFDARWGLGPLSSGRNGFAVSASLPF